MLLFQKEQIKKATHLNCFMDFINVIAPLYEEEIPIDIIASCHWNELEKKLNKYIIIGLHNLTNSAGHSPALVLPKILKGIYFCLADDALHFSIHGSLYYNEEDWAANADYDYKVPTELFMLLSNELVLLRVDSKIIQDLLYLFAAYTLFKTLRTLDNISDVANAAIALSYSDGDILTLGRFLDQQFHECIEIVDNGSYENSSTAPVEVARIASPQGDLWNYMRNNCSDFIRSQGLLEGFYALGETEAERINNEFKGQLNINRCSLCNAIKKTPRARLCLKCGEFTHPVLT